MTKSKGLLVIALAAALLTSCNGKDNAGGSNGATPADQSDQSNGRMGDDNYDTGTMHDRNGEATPNGEMTPQGRDDNGRGQDSMRHGMNDGNRSKTMMHRGMGKGHRMGM